MKNKRRQAPRARGSIIAVFLLFVLLLGGFYFAWNTVNDIFQPISASSRPVTIVVKENETIAQLAADLQAKGLIKSTLAFRIWSKIKGLDAHLQAGVFNNLKANMNVSDLVDQLQSAQPDQILVQIPEGWRLEQIANKVDQAKMPKFNKADFLNYTKHPDQFPDKKQFAILNDIPKGHGMEGLLFPDTYYFTLGSTTTDVIDTMLKELTAQVQDNHLDTSAKANKMTVYQMIILASVVERETAIDADRAKIASVYWNRIFRVNDETRGFFDSDPTVEYARDSQAGTTVYWKDLADGGRNIAPDSPWNTYTHPGWMPTPICGPSLASMKAAAAPAKTDFYFFLGRPDNGHAVFAKTQAEFNQDVAKYLNK